MQIMESSPGARAIINGREVDYFCGCGYLGLQGRPELVDAACEAMRKYGMGAATSRVGYGNNPPLVDVERNAAKFFGTEDALYFPSGYLGNFVLLQGLSDDYDVIFVDKHSHYSVRDAAATVHKPIIEFAHRDAGDLEVQLRNHIGPGQRPLVISDGAFAVSGRIAPIPDYLSVLERYDDFIVCVDDAHVVGVIGSHGRGCFEYHNLAGPKLYSCGTLSKAVGGYGGIIPCDSFLKDRLINRSHILRACSPAPVGSMAATAKALEILCDYPESRDELRDNVAHAKKGFRALGFDLDDTPVPIICLTGDPAKLERLPGELLTRDIVISRWYAGSEDYSSVPADGAVRIAIFATHTKEQIDHLVGEIGKLI